MSLLSQTVRYLEAHDWYFDAEAFRQVWDREPTPEDVLNARFWTVAQWANYWSSDHLEPVGPKPKKRRFEKLEDAIWSQVLREEKPQEYATFFDWPEPE